MESYQVLKSLHLFGVTIFLGNIIVTALWKVLADKTRSPSVVAFSQRLVTITDFAFTSTGALLIIITGRIMATNFSAIDDFFWLRWGWWL